MQTPIKLRLQERLLVMLICFALSNKSSAQIQEGFVNIEHGRLFYQEEGTGPPLLFLHGICLDHRMWDDQVRFFSNRFTCITVDLRGFGKSSLPAGPYSFHEDLDVLLDSLHIKDPVTIIALSMGGKAAINFAIAYPQKVNALILADVAVDGCSFKKFDLKPVNELAKLKGIDSANQLFLNNAVFAYSKKNDSVFNRLKEMILSYSGWQWLNKNPMQYLNPVAVQQLDKIQSAVLIITGEKDIQDFQDIATLLHNSIRGSILKTIKHAGHMCNMDNPRLFNDLALDFITAHQ